MDSIFCVEHPNRPADQLGADYGPPMCTECAASYGLRTTAAAALPRIGTAGGCIYAKHPVSGYQPGGCNTHGGSWINNTTGCDRR